MNIEKGDYIVLITMTGQNAFHRNKQQVRRELVGSMEWKALDNILYKAFFYLMI